MYYKSVRAKCQATLIEAYVTGINTNVFGVFDFEAIGFDFDRLAPLLVNTAPPQDLDGQMRVQYEAAQAMAAVALEDSGPAASGAESK